MMKPMMPAERPANMVFKRGSLNDRLDWAKANMVAARERLEEVGEWDWHADRPTPAMSEAGLALGVPSTMVADVMETYQRVRALQSATKQVKNLRAAMYAELTD